MPESHRLPMRANIRKLCDRHPTRGGRFAPRIADAPNAKRPYRAHTVSPATIVLTARPLKFQPSKGVLRDRDKDSSFL